MSVDVLSGWSSWLYLLVFWCCMAAMRILSLPIYHLQKPVAELHRTPAPELQPTINELVCQAQLARFATEWWLRCTLYFQETALIDVTRGFGKLHQEVAKYYSDWLNNKPLDHQRQQPVGSSSPHLETLICNCFEWSVESRKLKWKNKSWEVNSREEMRNL